MEQVRASGSVLGLSAPFPGLMVAEGFPQNPDSSGVSAGGLVSAIPHQSWLLDAGTLARKMLLCLKLSRTRHRNTCLSRAHELKSRMLPMRVGGAGIATKPGLKQIFLAYYRLPGFGNRIVQGPGFVQESMQSRSKRYLARLDRLTVMVRTAQTVALATIVILRARVLGLGIGKEVINNNNNVLLLSRSPGSGGGAG